MSTLTSQLFANYSTGRSLPDPPVVGVLDSSPKANPLFSDADRRIKDGSPFTSVMNAAYDGIINYWPTSSAHNKQISRLQAGNSYSVGRNVGAQVNPLFLLFCVTGDLRLLDILCRYAIEGQKGLRTTWHPESTITRAPHGKKFFPWLHSDRSFKDWGGDDHLTDSPRAFSLFAKIGWALDLNRHLASPGGFNYGQVADQWKSHFDGFERVWSKVDDAAFPAAAKVPQTYLGRFRPETGQGYGRANFNQYPINLRALTSDGGTSGTMGYYMGRLLGKSDSVCEASIHLVVDQIMNREGGVIIPDVTPQYGPAWMFSRDIRGWLGSDNTHYELPTTYFDDVATMLAEAWMIGNIGDYLSHEVMGYIANSINGLILQGSNPSAVTIKAGFTGLNSFPFQPVEGSAKAGIPNACASSSSQCSDRTRAFWAVGTFHLMLPWDTADDRMEEVGMSAWDHYEAGAGLAEPRALGFPVGLFLKEMDFKNKTLAPSA